MRKIIILTILTLVCLIPDLPMADTLYNTTAIDSATAGQEFANLSPGVRILLPGGKTAYIEEVLENGNYRTNLGQIISRRGIILEGEYKNSSITLAREDSKSHEEKVATGESVVSDEKRELRKEESETRIHVGKKNGKSLEKDEKSVVVAEKETSAPSTEPEAFDIEQMLAFSDLEKPDRAEGVLKTPESRPGVKGEKGKKADIQDEIKAEKKAEARADKKAEGKADKKAEGKAGKQGAQKMDAGAGKAEKKASAGKGDGGKVAVGKPMRIPPEAIKTGNLDFLEGCWEGTRPEYFSKRIVKECFCFGPGGKYGKRRINDSSYSRQCIGAANANLSRDGVLSVSSQSMACSDGVHWGAARMTCRNSGPQTPCSWIFTDAGNGKQAYVIPFIRVASCRR